MRNKIEKDYLQKILLIFFIGAFIGFVYEVIFYYFTENRLNNAGVLYGPWLPIYGTGAVCISLIIPKVKKHPLLLFFLCIIITGLLEYVIGYIYAELLHKKLWDYSNLFLNIDGYVCLRSVVTFAIGGLFLAYVIDPWLTKLIQNKRYYSVLHNILLVLLFLFIIDFILSKVLSRTPFLY